MPGLLYADDLVDVPDSKSALQSMITIVFDNSRFSWFETYVKSAVVVFCKSGDPSGKWFRAAKSSWY